MPHCAGSHPVSVIPVDVCRVGKDDRYVLILIRSAILYWVKKLTDVDHQACHLTVPAGNQWVGALCSVDPPTLWTVVNTGCVPGMRGQLSVKYRTTS
jgi:hypothetical protein